MTDFQGALWHGADYNPEQWLETPQILEKDLRLMNLAAMSSSTIGIFSWAMLEPREGEFHFDWLEKIVADLTQNGQKIVLATPSGAKPNWMARKYPEIRRVSAKGEREAQQNRHNHCPSSPVYRQKIAALNEELAQRFGAHQAVLAWHLSNEYGGECHCDLCFGAFQNWLKARYNNDLDALNQAYWSRFWSHTYGEWEEINFIDAPVHGLKLDWQRFTTHQCVDFMRHEIAALRQFSSLPVTTNMMGGYTGLDYTKFAPHLDFISWDSYPNWGAGENGDESGAACAAALAHDFFRALKKQPFWLMECCPAQTNWQPISKAKAPGVQRLAAWQTVAHGGDAVMYFQWRQSRGSSEKFHGAVVSHESSENTRVFREVAALGAELKALGEIAGSRVEAEVAVIWDCENLWAIWGEQGPRNVGKNPSETINDFYQPLWKRGIAVDVVNSEVDFSNYKLVVAPMLYMLKSGVAQRLTEFVRAGGTLVTTYWSGLANESDLCFLGGFPGPLREVLGIWVEETDTLHPHQSNRVKVEAPELDLRGEWEARDYCDILHAENAHVLATYQSDFYAGSPALTRNDFGKGAAFYIAARLETRFQDQFLAGLTQKLNLKRAWDDELPIGVVAQKRVSDEREWVWLSNLTSQSQNWVAPQNLERFEDGNWHILTAGEQILAPYDVAILRRDL